jgi:hypothetical protein
MSMHVHVSSVRAQGAGFKPHPRQRYGEKSRNLIDAARDWAGFQGLTESSSECFRCGWDSAN